ncbi:helix-turn-helix domain-containing protein [Pseudohoeflea suaedae]|nr:helix-turn-helix transcriptional regulator [Pseudohoeflea suaedae]
MIEQAGWLGLADIALRGGTVAILLLLVAHLLFRLGKGPVIVAGLAFCLSGIVEAVINVSPAVVDLDLSDLTFMALQQIHFIALFIFVKALFDDRFVWGGGCFIPVLFAVPLTLGAGLLDGTGSAIFRGLLVAYDAGLFFVLIRWALDDEASDLVRERRTFRRALTFSVPPFSLIVFLTTMFEREGQVEAILCTVYSAVYFMMAIGFGFWMTSAKKQLLVRPEPGEPRVAQEAELTSADRIELDRVVKAVDGGLYLEPGLTIGGLGDLLNIPEHRLRRLINKGLGYRNFAAFMNDYRIEEAKRRLADPDMAREQIVTHAFNLGYASLAPFNRAFRERVGISPSEYREQALADAISGASPA